MNRIAVKRWRMVAAWALITLLISQWTMAFHLCLPGEIPAVVESSSEPAAHGNCGGGNHQKDAPASFPCDDPWCALHCAQPDEITSSVKWPLPDAIIAGQFSVSTSPLAHRLAPSQHGPMEAPPRDARRRLIEYGALLI